MERMASTSLAQVPAGDPLNPLIGLGLEKAF
jgi:hypothetical protein